MRRPPGRREEEPEERAQRRDEAVGADALPVVVAMARVIASARCDNAPLGMVTFVDASKVRHKRDPGRCYLRAGFLRCGETKGGLLALRLAPEAMPAPLAPLGSTLDLFGGVG
jgi:hypothetical protein